VGAEMISALLIVLCSVIGFLAGMWLQFYLFADLRKLERELEKVKDEYIEKLEKQVDYWQEETIKQFHEKWEWKLKVK
jgi:uncharacterized protein YoxC